MANWQYADYESQPTAAARLSRLNLHIAEVGPFIANERSGRGSSMGSGSLVQYMQQLRDRRRELQIEARAEDGSGFSFPSIGW